MKMTPEILDNLVLSAAPAADFAAMEARTMESTDAEITRAIVTRTIEFLYGNSLVDILHDGTDKPMRIMPPFERWPDADSEGVNPPPYPR